MSHVLPGAHTKWLDISGISGTAAGESAAVSEAANFVYCLLPYEKEAVGNVIGK